MRAEQLMTELKTTAMTTKGSSMKFWSKEASSASYGKSNPPVLQIPVSNDKSLINRVRCWPLICWACANVKDKDCLLKSSTKPCNRWRKEARVRN